MLWVRRWSRRLLLRCGRLRWSLSVLLIDWEGRQLVSARLRRIADGHLLMGMLWIRSSSINVRLLLVVSTRRWLILTW